MLSEDLLLYSVVARLEPCCSKCGQQGAGPQTAIGSQQDMEQEGSFALIYILAQAVTALGLGR